MWSSARSGKRTTGLPKNCFSRTPRRFSRGPSIRFHRSRNVMLRDLAEASWVVPKEGAPLRIYFESLFRESGLALPRSIVETDSLIAMRSLLINDDRLTIISAASRGV